MSQEVYTISIETVYRDAGANAGLQNLTRSMQQASTAAQSLQGFLSGRSAGSGIISIGGGFGRGMPGFPQAGAGAGGGGGGGVIPPVTGGPGNPAGNGAGMNGAAQGANAAAVAVSRLGQALRALQQSRSARIAVTGLESVQAASGAVTGLLSGLNALRFYAAAGVSAYAISQPFNTFAQRQRQQNIATNILRGNAAGGAAFTQNINQLATQTGLGDQMRQAAMTMLGPAQLARPDTAAQFTEENARKIAALSLARGLDPNALASMVASAMTGRRVFTPEMAQALEASGIPVYDIIAAGLNSQAQAAGRPTPGLSRAGVMSMLREGVLPGVATTQAILNFADSPEIREQAERNRRDALGTKERALAALGDISASWGEAVATTLMSPLEALAQGNPGRAFQMLLPQVGPINQGGETGGGALATTGLMIAAGGLLSRRILRQEFGGVALGRRVGQALGVIPRLNRRGGGGAPRPPRVPGGGAPGPGGGAPGGGAPTAPTGGGLTSGLTSRQLSNYQDLIRNAAMPPELASAAVRGDVDMGTALSASLRARGELTPEITGLLETARAARAGTTAAEAVGEAGRVAGAAGRASGVASRLGRIGRVGGRIGGILTVAGLALGAADILTTRQAEAAGLEQTGATAQVTGENVVGTALPLAAGMVNPVLGLGVAGILGADQAFGGGRMTQDLGRRLAPFLSFMTPQQDQINSQMRDITNLNDPYIKQIGATTQALRDLTNACRIAATCLGRCPGGGGAGGGFSPIMPQVPAGPPAGTLGPDFNPADPKTWPKIVPKPMPGIQTGTLGVAAGMPGVAATGPWADTARAIAAQYGVNPDIFAAQMSQESGNFAPDVISGGRLSSAGARGIAQQMPAFAAGAAAKLGVSLDQYWSDPKLQLAGAAMSDAGYSNWRDALVAYNAGTNRIGLPNSQLPSETQTYLQNILGSIPGSTPVSSGPQVNVTMNNTFTNPADSPDTVATLSDQIINQLATQLNQVDTGVAPGPALVGAPIG